MSKITIVNFELSAGDRKQVAEFIQTILLGNSAHGGADAIWVCVSEHH